MFNLDLPWKPFNISTIIVQDWLRTNIETPFSGVSSNYLFQIHFTSEPSSEEREAILEYWNNLDEESEEALNYLSKEERELDKQAKKASAKAKLIALGLTEAEVKALLD